MDFNILKESHAGSWAILVVLFIVSVIFNRQKITPMITRLFYLIMLFTGISMLIKLEYPTTYVVKGILAIVLIGLMEMIMGRSRRREKTVVLWVAFIVVLAIIVSLGYGLFSF